jgi:hypothetical protein
MVEIKVRYFETTADADRHAKLEAAGRTRVTAEDGRVFFVLSGGRLAADGWVHPVVAEDDLHLLDD